MSDKLLEVAVSVDALKSAMDRILGSSSDEHARYISYKGFASRYNELAEEYSAYTGDMKLRFYKLDMMKSHMDLLWPVQKEFFEDIYTQLLILKGRLDFRVPRKIQTGFNELIHPLIEETSMRHYSNGDFRNAVLDSIIVVFDKIRERTGIDADGEALVSRAFSLNSPYLILTELDTDSGQSEQKGFIEICKGLYKGIRNPKAHSLNHDLDEIKAAQYLVLSSIIMRRILDAKGVHNDT